MFLPKMKCIVLGFSADFECNRFIDQVIESRRSIRKFKAEAPTRELIDQILQAGLLAHPLPELFRGKILDDSLLFHGKAAQRSKLLKY
jgi:hypothetical protein